MDYNHLELKLSKNNEIIFNDIFKLKKLQQDKEKLMIFEYLIGNPNRNIPIDELEEKAVNRKLKKELYDTIRGFGLNKQLREIFFNLNKNEAYFRNPVSKSFLNEYLSENRFKYIPLSMK